MKSYLKVRSRHPSHDVLRRTIRVAVPTVVRFGSSTVVDPRYREINTVQACANSADKSKMKTLFLEHDVKTAIYINPRNEDELVQWVTNNDLIDRPLIIKSYRGSRGRGLYKVNNLQEAVDLFAEKRYGNHIVEKFYNYNREYRLHVAKDGCFYTCRKMLKEDAVVRWYRNDSNSVWILEENPAFDKPSNWTDIVENCVKALNATGLDLGACDVRVQGSDKQTPDFIICEINSAPSFGERTAEKYTQKLIEICAI